MPVELQESSERRPVFPRRSASERFFECVKPVRPDHLGDTLHRVSSTLKIGSESLTAKTARGKWPASIRKGLSPVTPSGGRTRPESMFHAQSGPMPQRIDEHSQRRHEDSV